MGTQIIAQRQHSEIPALRVEIIAQPRISGPGSIYMVTRDGGGIDGQYLFNYLSCGRSTEAEAREVANFLWTDAVQRVRKHQQAGQSDPFEVVGAAEVVEVPAGVTITGRTWNPNMAVKRFNDIEEVVDELMATTPAEVDSRPALVFPAAEPFKFEHHQLHELNGEVYRIKISKTSLRPYAERLDSTPEGEAKPVYVYTPNMMYLLGPDTLMTQERRAELGRIMVHCLDCGAHLTHPISVARGIGPVCSGLGYSE